MKCFACQNATAPNHVEMGQENSIQKNAESNELLSVDADRSVVSRSAARSEKWVASPSKFGSEKLFSSAERPLLILAW